jgi:hypothetical protein
LRRPPDDGGPSTLTGASGLKLVVEAQASISVPSTLGGRDLAPEQPVPVLGVDHKECRRATDFFNSLLGAHGDR